MYEYRYKAPINWYEVELQFPVDGGGTTQTCVTGSYAAAASEVGMSRAGSSDVISRMMYSVEFGVASVAVAARISR